MECSIGNVISCVINNDSLVFFCFEISNICSREKEEKEEEEFKKKSGIIKFPSLSAFFVRYSIYKRGNETPHLIYMITLINLRFIIDWILRMLSNRNIRISKSRIPRFRWVTRYENECKIGIISILFITDIIIHYVILVRVIYAMRYGYFFFFCRIIRLDNLKRKFACLIDSPFSVPRSGPEGLPPVETPSSSLLLLLPSLGL